MPGCIEPYPTTVSDDKAGYLVVDGFLNTAAQRIEVKLSRAIPLENPEVPVPETEAIVKLQDEDGNLADVPEDTPGTYSAAGLFIDISKRYRLLITTKQNKVYTSALVELKPTPPIEDLQWIAGPDGVTIKVSTHDDTKQSRYYKWKFEETYELRPAYDSRYKMVNRVVSERGPGESIFICWQTKPSSQILISSSQRLSDDVIHEFPLTFIPKDTDKLLYRYSILVKQRTLTHEAYLYYDQLKKTTEQLGGLFDPQPGQVTGNFTCVSNPGELVLGYFSGGTEEEKRLFINFNDLPGHLQIYPIHYECAQDTVLIVDLVAFDNVRNNLINEIWLLDALLGYSFSNIPCTDCRKKGGQPVRPDFW